MKTPLTFFLLLLSVRLLAVEQPLKSTIKSVTVYLDGAQVSRTAALNLTAGEHILIAQGLPAGLDPQSIQVDGPAGLVLLGVSHEIDYLNKQIVKEQAVQLREQADVLREEVKRLQARLQVFEQEEKLLLNNQNLGGSQQGVSVGQLREAAAFFRERLQEIKLSQLDLQQQIRKRQEQIGDINKSLQDVHAKDDKPTAKVLIKLRTDKAMTGMLSFSYLVKEAGWFPAYDVRVQEVGKPLLLQYKARVFQQTGEDWSKVQLTLSTGNPGVDNNRPELDPQRIQFSELVRVMPKSRSAITQVSGQVRSASDRAPLPGVTVAVQGTTIGTVTNMDGRYSLSLPRDNQMLSFSFIGFTTQVLPVSGSVLNVLLQEEVNELSEVVVTAYGAEEQLEGRIAGVQVREKEEKPVIKIRGTSSIAAPEVVQQQNAVTTEFILERPYTVTSDGRQQTVEVAQHNMPAFYRYYTAPAISESAYLTTGITNWETFNLLEGEANLFFEGKFVGKTLLDPNRTGDTLSFSLGKDRNVVVTRKQLKDFQEKKLFGSKRKETKGWEIVVRNAKEQPIQLVVQDRYPLSQHEAITVKLEEKSGAQLDEKTGLLRWQLTLPPRETKNLQLRYTLEYPKERTVTIF